MKRALLILNLGSPDAPTPEAVAPYLKEFLSDADVLTLPALLRYPLVHWWIAPRRSPNSAHAYKKIWTEAGSPLVVHTRNLSAALQEKLTQEFDVEFAMRYGKPSIESALAKFMDKGVEHCLVFPLYPQYAASSTLSAIKAVRAAARNLDFSAPLDFVRPFYDQAEFLDAFAENCRAALAEFPADHVLFSYHGLPISAVGADCNLIKKCSHLWQPCGPIGSSNSQCYRAQCFATTEEIRARLGLASEKYSVAFQSRLTERWIQPFTDKVLEELPKKGVRKLLVVSPSFVADCLETLEELAMRAAEDFKAYGGTELRLVPSLNANPAWVAAVAAIARRAAQN